MNNLLLKRLPGYDIEITDKNNEKLLVGDTVRINYTMFEKEYDENIFILGKIKYDYLNDKFIIRLLNPIRSFNNNDRNLILEIKEDYLYKKAIELDKRASVNYYEKCIDLLNNDEYLFYEEIFDLFEDDEIHLLDNEIAYIKSKLDHE